MSIVDEDYSLERDEYIVRLVDVSKIYRVSEEIYFHALRNVNLSIHRRDYIAIMGPSGHGKTTLLNMIGLLDRPTSGRVYIGGIDTSRLSDVEISHLRNRVIGFVFQFYNLISRMTVLENIELPLLVRGIPRGERIRMVTEALLRVGGEESWLGKRPNQLSGGQQQRVAIARAIVGDPEIILADEPTGNLDTESSIVVMDVFDRLIEMGKTIILVTHARDIANCARKIIYIRDGRLVDEAETDRSTCICSLGGGGGG